ncbi:hypothetical protein TL16_g00887, partial [Triparma laevis f. inornata]
MIFTSPEMLLFALLSTLLRPVISKNVLLIVIDDLGSTDLSPTPPSLPPGSTPLLTPFLTSLYTSPNSQPLNLHTSPQCTPSRSSLLTGYTPETLGLSHYVLVNGQDLSIPLQFPLLPQYLPNHTSHLFGKWHVGHARNSYTPLERGYEIFKGYYLGSTDFFEHVNNEVCCCEEVCSPLRTNSSFNQSYIDLQGYDVTLPSGYSTDIVTEDVLKVIDDYDGEKDFFLHVNFPATHSGPDGLPQYKESDVDPDLYARSPKRAGFDAMLKNLDSNIERIFKSLQDKRLLDGTLVIILSDNGGETSSGASNYPLRGEKFTYFEGGIKTPAMIINSDKMVVDRIVGMEDILPSIIDDLNHDLIVTTNTLFEGESIFKSSSREYKVLLDPVYHCGTVFYSSYKLVVNGTCGYDVIFNKPYLGGWSKPDDSYDNKPSIPKNINEVMLFNLNDDEEERVDLSEAKKDLVEEMLKVYKEREREVRGLERQSIMLGDDIEIIRPKGGGKIGPWLPD